MNEAILNKALELTELIETTANAALELALGFEQTKADQEFVEAALVQEIAAETDDKGKAVFSNESSRAAELIVRCRMSDLHRQGIALLRRNAEAKNSLQNQLEKYRNQLAVYKAFLNGGTA